MPYSGRLLLRVADAVGGFVLDQRLGQVDVDRVDHRREGAIAHHAVGLSFLHLGQLLAKVVAQLGDRVELRGRRGERIVGVGQAQRLHILDQHPERRGAGELLAETLRGKLLVELDDVAGLRAEHLRVHGLAELPRPDRVEIFVAGQRVERLAGAGRRHAHGEQVGLLRGPLDRLELGELPLQALDPGVDVGLGGLGRRLHDLHALVLLLRELQTRPHLDRGREDERLAGLELLDVDLGIADRRKVLVATASRKYVGTLWCTNSSSTTSRPTWASMIGFGALPGRNPGILISRAIDR